MKINKENKLFLYDKYINEELSCLEIAKLYKVKSPTTILNWLRKFNIEIRSSEISRDIKQKKRLININGLIHRKCTTCGKLLPRNKKYFSINKDIKDGLNCSCKKCSLKRSRISNLKNYGIDEKGWNYLFQKQKGCCAICRRHQSNFKKSLHIDHNHKTGEVRGLLCPACNRGIGLLQDSIEMLENAKNYLIKY